jgi:hypothetical protein
MRKRDRETERERERERERDVELISLEVWRKKKEGGLKDDCHFLAAIIA